MVQPLIDFACQLIDQPSVSPQDGLCQQLIGARLQAAAWHTQPMPFGETSNLWALHRTDHKAPLLVLAGHTDVVPAGDENAWQTPPFNATIQEGMLYGRGACDMKAALAAMVFAALDFTQAHPNYVGNIGFLLTSDEEGAATDGTQRVMRELVSSGVAIDAVLIGEPSSSKHVGDTLRYGRRGSMSFNLRVHGKQGHVAYPHLADNPIHKVGGLLDALAQAKLDDGNHHFPPSSLQVVSVQAGGQAGNIIPAHIDIAINIRFSTEQTPESLIALIEKIINDCALRSSSEYTHRVSGLPFCTDVNKPIVQAAQQGIKEVCGLDTTLSTGGGTSDGRFIAPYGVDVVELGAINATAHQVNESICCADLLQLKKVYQATLTHFFRVL